MARDRSYGVQGEDHLHAGGPPDSGGCLAERKLDPVPSVHSRSCWVHVVGADPLAQPPYLQYDRRKANVVLDGGPPTESQRQPRSTTDLRLGRIDEATSLYGH